MNAEIPRDPCCGYRLTFQSDGNLVVYTFWGLAVWASGTNGSGAAYAVLQGDGNLVLYRWDHSPVWASGTRGYVYDQLVMQTDGNAVIYSGSSPVWASNSNRGYLGSSYCPPSRVVDYRTYTDMPGGDLYYITMSQADPVVCASACAEDTRCNAYTYVPPNVQGPNAMCWIKSTYPTPYYGEGMVSGIVYH